VLGQYRFTARTQRGGTEYFDSAWRRTHVSHDEKGFVRRWCPSGSMEVLRYRPDGKLEARLVQRRAGQGLGDGIAWTTRYTYSLKGDLLQVDDSLRGTTRFEVDRAHRLSAELTHDNQRLSYTHDSADNLVELAGQRISIGKGNLVASTPEESFQHDDRERVSRRLSRDGSSTSYVYDTFDMLLSAERRSPTDKVEWRFEAEYDALGQRVLTKSKDGKREFFWDHDRLSAEILPDGRLRVFQYASRGALTPLGFVEYEGRDEDPRTGKSYSVFSDPVGMPLCIEDEQAKVVWWADRVDPFGAVTVREGAELEYNLRWPGHYFDAVTGLHYNRYRYYDPKLGRYLQSDPVGHDGSPTNLYAYCSNPLVNVDVLGLEHGGKTNKSAKDGGEHEGVERTARPANEEEVSPITGKKVEKAAEVIEYKDKNGVIAGRSRPHEGRSQRAPRAARGGQQRRQYRCPTGRPEPNRQARLGG
jgi:RHS repeat-associated protein